VAADSGATNPLPQPRRSTGGGVTPDPPIQASGDGGIRPKATLTPNTAGDGGVAREAMATSTGGVASARPAGVLKKAA